MRFIDISTMLFLVIFSLTVTLVMMVYYNNYDLKLLLLMFFIYLMLVTASLIIVRYCNILNGSLMKQFLISIVIFFIVVFMINIAIVSQLPKNDD